MKLKIKLTPMRQVGARAKNDHAGYKMRQGIWNGEWKIRSENIILNSLKVIVLNNIINCKL